MTRHFLLSLAFFAGAAGSIGSASAMDSEDLTSELEQAQRDMQKMIGQLQEKAAVGGITGDRLTAARAKVMRLAADERFLQAANELWNHPKRATLLWADLAFFVLMFFVKAWRQWKARTWIGKAFVGLALSLFTWAGLVFVLPALVLGQPFHVFIGTLWRVLTT